MIASSAAAGPVVVVGVDGSEPSLHALAWALSCAAQTGGSVRVVRGWSISTAPRPATQTKGYAPPMSDYEQAVLEALRDECAPVLGAHPDVPVDYEQRYGAAANGLLDAAREADLLVVGARGGGGFRGLALGSVSDQCVRHSPVPVVVVREEHSADIERTTTLDPGREHD